MSNTDKKKRIIVALDFSSEAQALAFTESLDPQQCRVKVGKELFTRTGPALVKRLIDDGFDVFLDLKFHDIPNTTAAACAAAADLGVWMLNVHALGGRRMMEAAKEAVDETGNSDILLVAVTILTSLAAQDLHEVGLAGEPRANVLRLAGLAQESGLHGVVCSAQEATAITAHCGKDFALVTPGVRPKGSALGDQKRVVTPSQAILNGAHYLVMGRPITQADQPLNVLQAVHSEIGA